MTVLCNENIRANPLGIGGNEGIRWFQPFGFIFDTQLERNLEIFVNRNERKKRTQQVTENDGGEVPSNLVYDKPGDADRVGGKPFNKNIQQMFRRSIPDKTYGKAIFVGVKDEQQAWLPRDLPLSFGLRQSGLFPDAASWAKKSLSSVAGLSEDIRELFFENLLLSLYNHLLISIPCPQVPGSVSKPDTSGW